MRLSTTVAATAVASGAIASAQSSLVPLKFKPFPLGSIKASGWLQNELVAEGNGLAGHEHDFYDYVAHSSWTGGNREYSDLNEGFPYWFNGLVPLAYSLNDDRLKAQVHAAADYVLSHQQSDGWIGPEAKGARYMWGRYPFFLGLIGLAEANSTWTGRISDSMHTFFNTMNTMLQNDGEGMIWHQGDTVSQGDQQWGQVRSPDLMITLMWFIENDPRNDTTLLYNLLNLVYKYSDKWQDYYNQAAYIFDDLSVVAVSDPNRVNNAFPYTHGVNVGQGLKGTAVYRRFLNNDSMIQTTYNAVNWTYTFHGSPAGAIMADEREEGLAPFSGAELCTAVESMYSLSYLYQALGVNEYADRCEKAAFNAMPAMITTDWWAHQYFEQSNQGIVTTFPNQPFWNGNPYSITFGLEPDYPCCTVNHPQGLPKFLAATFVDMGSDGIAHALLSPATLNVTKSGKKYQIACTTNYPFADSLSYSITADAAFNFHVRVPTWTTSATPAISLNGKTQSVTADSTTGMVTIAVPSGKSTINYSLSPKVVVENRPNSTVAIHRGALTYSLFIDADYVKSKPVDPSGNNLADGYAPSQAYTMQIHNRTAWAVAIDPSTITFNDTKPTTLNNPIYAPGAAPVSMNVKACEIAWALERNETPGLAPSVANRKCAGSVFTAKLVPYGGAKIRMTELPTMKLS